MLVETMFPPPFVGVILNEVPEQIVSVCAVLTIGPGFTVNVNILDVPLHEEPKVGVTVTVVEIGVIVVFVATNVGIFPIPLAANPTAVFELVQENVVPVEVDVKFVSVKLAPAHIV